MRGRIINGKIDMSRAAVYSESGVLVNQLVRYTIDQGMGGLEYFLGLPGTVGGAVYINASYPKASVSLGNALLSAKVLTSYGDIREVSNSYFLFAFDSSYLQKTQEILLSAVF